MKMKKKALSLAAAFIAAIMIFSAAPGSFATKAFAAGNAPLDGIDYTRLTQKATTDTANFRVVMVLGNVELAGSLAGTEGLTMEEINEVIEQQLRALGLSLAEVGVLSSLGDKLTREQYKQLWKKLAVALSEYIPSVGPEGIISPTSIIKSILYGHDPLLGSPLDYAEGKGKELLEKKITEALQNQAAKMGKRIPKAGGGLGLVGFALNSISAGKDLLDDTEYDRFCKELEEKYQKIAEFYIKCSQKLNEQVELKNFGRRSIKFDEYSTAVSECVFLGVDGVRLRYKLSGFLKRNSTGDDEMIDPGDNSGTYEGDLKLEIEGYDLAKDFDAVFADKSMIWTGASHVNDWGQILYRFEGAPAIYRDNFLNKFIFTVNRPTYLKRTLVGHFTVTVPSGKIRGTVTPRLSGAFNNVSDGIDFLFRMTFGQEFKVHATKPGPFGMPVDLGVPIQQWHVETLLQGAKAINSLHCSWVGNEAARVMMENSVGSVMYGGEGADILITSRDLGTVWYMLENAPKIEISSID